MRKDLKEGSDLRSCLRRALPLSWHLRGPSQLFWTELLSPPQVGAGMDETKEPEGSWQFWERTRQGEELVALEPPS